MEKIKIKERIKMFFKKPWVTSTIGIVTFWLLFLLSGYASMLLYAVFSFIFFSGDTTLVIASMIAEPATIAIGAWIYYALKGKEFTNGQAMNAFILSVLSFVFLLMYLILSLEQKLLPFDAGNTLVLLSRLIASIIYAVKAFNGSR